MKRTAILLAEGFEEVEALTAVDLLRRAGLGCDMVSLADTDTVCGSHGICVRADRPFTGTDFDIYDGLLLPGGKAGTERLLNDRRVAELLGRLAAQGRLLAAICAAPTVLGAAGLLEGRTAVCYPGLEDKLTGARVVYEETALDGPVLTSRGLGTAIPFALAIVRYFEGPAKAEALAASVVYRQEG